MIRAIEELPVKETATSIQLNTATQFNIDLSTDNGLEADESFSWDQTGF